jgi:hypothetical protein
MIYWSLVVPQLTLWASFVVDGPEVFVVSDHLVYDRLDLIWANGVVS